MIRTLPSGHVSLKLEGTLMCGIVGYIGPRDATPIILNGLKRLEYRGYDSAGVAVLAMVAAASVANLAGAVLADPDHASIGASTAVFAGIGSRSGRNRTPQRVEGW